MYTSLELSKKLAEVGFDKKKDSEYFIDFDKFEASYTNLTGYDGFDVQTDRKPIFYKSCPWKNIIEMDYHGRQSCRVIDCIKYYPSYDILNDLCVKYHSEVWGDDYFIDELEDYDLPLECNGVEVNYSYEEGGAVTIKRKSCLAHSHNIIYLLQQDKQEEAELYILENSILFNQEK